MNIVSILITILVAALAYWICLAVGLPSIIAIIAALLVILGFLGGGASLPGGRR